MIFQSHLNNFNNRSTRAWWSWRKQWTSYQNILDLRMDWFLSMLFPLSTPNRGKSAKARNNRPPPWFGIDVMAQEGPC